MKKITWIYIRFVQKILITVLLTVTYLFIFPLTWLMYQIFHREKLFRKYTKKTSYWKAESILSDDIDQFTNQS